MAAHLLFRLLFQGCLLAKRFALYTLGAGGADRASFDFA
jgi:hypothetical protein